jgi:hypothetical protein
MTERDALTRLVAALDAYFAAKGTTDPAPFNALLLALVKAKAALAQGQG